MSTGIPQSIAVEGPIGVGKTSLAQRLGEALGYALLLEKAEENPFLERFYQDQRSHALPTQLHFLLQRAQQRQALFAVAVKEQLAHFIEKPSRGHIHEALAHRGNGGVGLRGQVEVQLSRKANGP